MPSTELTPTSCLWLLSIVQYRGGSAAVGRLLWSTPAALGEPLPPLRDTGMRRAGRRTQVRRCAAACTPSCRWFGTGPLEQNMNEPSGDSSKMFRSSLTIICGEHVIHVHPSSSSFFFFFFFSFSAQADKRCSVLAASPPCLPACLGACILYANTAL